VKPKYFIPVHGEYRHLFRHAALAHQLGCVSQEILLLEDGRQIEFTEDGVHRRDPVTAGRVCVDSGSLEEIEEVVIRDRKHLSEDGIVVPIIAIDKHTGKMESHPEIVSRGLMSDNGQELIAGARLVIMKTVEDRTRGKIRLGRHQGKNPRGPEALYQQTNFQAAADSSRDPRGLADWPADGWTHHYSRAERWYGGIHVHSHHGGV